MARKRKKIYYPQGQIQNGLYTSGGEWMLEDGTEYIGDYHRYLTGEVLTRGSYSRTLSEKLIPYINLSDTALETNFQYTNLIDSEVNDFVFAHYSKPIPSEKDYTAGFFYRYFAKRHFNDIITEINKDTFGKLQKEHYVKIRLAWKITGNTESINRKQVLDGDGTIKGLASYITDYTEYRQNLTLF